MQHQSERRDATVADRSRAVGTIRFQIDRMHDDARVECIGLESFISP
jgi:hypothetical protein